MSLLDHVESFWMSQARDPLVLSFAAWLRTQDVSGAPTGELEAAQWWQARKEAAGWGRLNWERAHGGIALSVAQVRACRMHELAFAAFSDMSRLSVDVVARIVARAPSVPFRDAALARIATGELWTWGVREPQIGDDLTRVETVARYEDGRWRLTGKKIWARHACSASHSLILTRADRGALSDQKWFAVPLDAPGVRVLAIPLSSGRTEFGEILLNDVEVGDESCVAPACVGWAAIGDPTGVEETYPEFVARDWCRTVAPALSPIERATTARAGEVLDRFVCGAASSFPERDRLCANLIARNALADAARALSEEGAPSLFEGINLHALVRETRLEWGAAHRLKQRLGQLILDYQHQDVSYSR